MTRIRGSKGGLVTMTLVGLDLLTTAPGNSTQEWMVTAAGESRLRVPLSPPAAGEHTAVHSSSFSLK